MVLRNPDVVPVPSGPTIISVPAVTVRSEISGMLLRNSNPLYGVRVFAYYAGENDLISSCVVEKDGKWKIDDLPTTALYDIRFMGRGTTPSDWLYDIQAYVIEEQFDITPPDNSMVAVGSMDD